MEKKKLKLAELNVGSFITEVSTDEKQTVDGGLTNFISNVVSGVVISVSAWTINDSQATKCGEQVSDRACGDSHNAFCWIVKSDNLACQYLVTELGGIYSCAALH
jgi:hypothetical protein